MCAFLLLLKKDGQKHRRIAGKTGVLRDGLIIINKSINRHNQQQSIENRRRETSRKLALAANNRWQHPNNPVITHRFFFSFSFYVITLSC